jgi:hypothetical protein
VTDEYTAELTVAATPSGTQPDPETSRYMALNFGLQWSVDPFIFDPSLFWSYQGDAQWIEAFSLDEQGGRQFYYMQMLEEPPWIQFVSVPEAGTIIWNEGTTTWNITANLSANTNANIFYISPSVYVDESGYGRLSVQLDLNIKKNGISIGTYTTTRDSTNDTTWAMINTTDGTVTIYPSPSPSPEPPIWTCELEDSGEISTLVLVLVSEQISTAHIIPDSLLSLESLQFMTSSTNGFDLIPSTQTTNQVIFLRQEQ